MNSKNIAHYLERYSVGTRWSLVTNDMSRIDNAVVIPSLAEKDHLFATLASIAHNARPELDRTLVICVINNGEHRHAAPGVVDNNQDTLAILGDLLDGRVSDTASDRLSPDLAAILENGLRLAVVDASSPGRELPEKDRGVGLARKIGFDLALHVFDDAGNTPGLLFSLDADTLVANNYLRAVRTYFARHDRHAAFIAFQHQDGDTPDAGAAIACYETFLRYYVLGLWVAGSPYAVHSIGSTIACTAEGYAAVRGMNKRKAGEDFYFLNKLAKLRGVGFINATTVYPSARQSDRVPFGTGRRITRFLEGQQHEYILYNPEVFAIIRKWLDCMASCVDERSDAPSIMECAASIHPLLFQYLDDLHFDKIWCRLKRNTNSVDTLWYQFHVWFDGFRTLKLINFLTRHGIEPVSMFDAVRQLLVMAGADAVPTDRHGVIPSLEVQLRFLAHLRDYEHCVLSERAHDFQFGETWTGNCM
jgi:hypothetical protein